MPAAAHPHTPRACQPVSVQSDSVGSVGSGTQGDRGRQVQGSAPRRSLPGSAVGVGGTPRLSTPPPRLGLPVPARGQVSAPGLHEGLTMALALGSGPVDHLLINKEICKTVL